MELFVSEQLLVDYRALVAAVSEAKPPCFW